MLCDSKRSTRGTSRAGVAFKTRPRLWNITTEGLLGRREGGQLEARDLELEAQRGREEKRSINMREAREQLADRQGLEGLLKRNELGRVAERREGLS